jgi:hypothetical protein
MRGAIVLSLALTLPALLALPAHAQLREVAPDPVGPKPYLFTLPPDLLEPTPEEPLPNSRRTLQSPGPEAGPGKGLSLGAGGAANYKPSPGRTINGGVATGVKLERGPGFLSTRRQNPAVGTVEE